MSIWKSVLSHAAIGGLAVSLALPAFAAPLPLLKTAPVPVQTHSEAPANVLKVDHRRGHNPHRGYNNRNGRHYYNGHRGYRKYRQGYRRYNGWWFPPAAFAFGFGVAPGPAMRPHLATQPPALRRPASLRPWLQPGALSVVWSALSVLPPWRQQLPALSRTTPCMRLALWAVIQAEADKHRAGPLGRLF